MQQGKHQEYEKKLYEQYNVVLRYVIIIIIQNQYLTIFSFLLYSRRPENSPPIQISSGNNSVIENLSQNNKESWPSLNNGTSRNDSPGKISINVYWQTTTLNMSCTLIDQI